MDDYLETAFDFCLFIGRHCFGRDIYRVSQLIRR